MQFNTIYFVTNPCLLYNAPYFLMIYSFYLQSLCYFIIFPAGIQHLFYTANFQVYKTCEVLNKKLCCMISPLFRLLINFSICAKHEILSFLWLTWGIMPAGDHIQCMLGFSRQRLFLFFLTECKMTSSLEWDFFFILTENCKLSQFSKITS